VERGNGIHARYTSNQKRVWGERQSLELSGQTTRHEEGARVQDESVRSWKARGGDCKEKTKQHELAPEKLAERRSPSTTAGWRRGERVWGAQRCGKVGQEAGAREVKMDIVEVRSAWRTDI